MTVEPDADSILTLYCVVSCISAFNILLFESASGKANDENLQCHLISHTVVYVSLPVQHLGLYGF